MKIALLFPGYTSQYVGMGKELYDEYRIVQEYFEEASNCVDVNFVKLCFASSDTELGKLAHAYMSLFLMGSSVFALLKEHGIIPDVAAGYNNGEITTLFAGGCFSFPDGLYLLNKFSSFYQEALDQMDISMIRIIGKTTKDIEQVCRLVTKNKKDLPIAFYDGPYDHVVVGSRDTIGLLHNALETAEKVTVEYPALEIGLHSHFMNDTIEQFKIYLEKVDFKDVHIPMISGIDGNIITRGEELKERFIRHFLEPFKFTAIIDVLKEYDYIIVSAPTATLAKKIKEYYPEKNIVTIEKKGDVEALKELLQHIPQDNSTNKARSS
jgi:[acyl-carrier-protein] S-malonyltransferase